MQSLLNEFCNWKNLIKATNEATVYFSALGCFFFFFGGNLWKSKFIDRLKPFFTAQLKSNIIHCDEITLFQCREACCFIFAKSVTSAGSVFAK